MPSGNYIGTEHILLGLLREEESLAARVLEGLDITIEEVRAQVARIVGQGDDATTGQIPFTPRAKKVFELALRDALSLGHNYIGTEHILLALVSANQSEGVAVRILLDFGVDAETIRGAVLPALGGGQIATRGLLEPGEFWDAEGHDRVSLEHHGVEHGPFEPLRSGALYFAVALAAVGFPLGLLVGYFIWG